MKNFVKKLLPIAILMPTLVMANNNSHGITDGTNLRLSSAITLINAWELMPSDAQIDELSQNVQWQRLLLIKDGKSMINDNRFLLADGTPKAELLALLTALKTPNSPVICQFPARSFWLSQELNRPFYDEHCQAWQAWRDEHLAAHLSLVFADEHPNILASAFAHVLLRADASNNVNDDTAWAINYTVAINPDDSMVKSGVKSIVGRYSGVMEILPYTQKRDNYLVKNARDIWEYTLSLNEQEVAQIMRHIWEVKLVNRPYYFTHDNCATEILRLIDVVRADSDLLTQADNIITPSEIVRLLKDNQFITAGRLVPSVTTQAQAKLNADYHQAPMPTMIRSDGDPADSNPTHRLGLAVGQQTSKKDTQTTYGISLRSAYQDMLDNPKGVRQYLDVKLLSLDMRYDNDKLKVQEATILSTRSYNPANTAKANNGKAWGAHLRLQQATDASDSHNDDHLVLDARMEKGKAWTIGQGALDTGALSDTLCYVFGAYGGQVGHINQGYRVGVGVNFGCVHHVNDRFRVLGEVAVPYWYHGEGAGYWQPSLSMGAQVDISRHHALRLTGKSERNHGDASKELQLQYLHYF